MISIYEEEEQQVLRDMPEGSVAAEQAIRRVRRLSSAWAAARPRIRLSAIRGPDGEVHSDPNEAAYLLA
eukprot:1982766-Pyramimonas_sp.AAC.1